MRPGFGCRKGDERRFEFRHLVPQRLCKAVAVAGRAGYRIGHASCRDDTGIALIRPRIRLDDEAMAPRFNGFNAFF